MSYWCIKRTGRHEYLDITTISLLRKDAWIKWVDGWKDNNGKIYPQAKRMRRRGEYTAVKVEVSEIETMSEEKRCQ